MSKRYPEKAVRLALERLDEYGSPTRQRARSARWVDVHHETLRLWREYIAGSGDKAIATSLNLDNIPCPSARRPDQNRHRAGDGCQGPTVTAILRNPHYTGYAVFALARRPCPVNISCGAVFVAPAARGRCRPLSYVRWCTTGVSLVR
ncbi:recombinase family protein [Nocardia stercoris]